MHPKKAKAMMTKEQAMLADGSIKQDQYDKQLLSKIGKSQLDELSSKDLQVLAIFREMNAGTVLDPQMIKMKMSVKKSMQQFLSNFPNYQVLTRLWIGIENTHMATL
ncbi:Cell division protein FtsI [Peptidoglycan synthetase] / Transpeptidase, Penicillin binding protein transpeptidase domain, Penicillin-binding protein 3 [Staphylococcus aureus]|uniref:Cell division protein FtsI [Peptidoglycan synthetase] / Transpeptidase, Penicillin binding protein transpeptidase domain, Penicillin-binding protein 3 n=1 Tax=Staphylococcus aureus TaxID=1280 RepID=A0A2X2KCH6_STAAU|nr:Cell division protein FtsI [Peptidoglycan synthetase] / Transpeptidase, Penicillin binding protein transpeptidase domain, Penicillin-binding protein 3 [Staphylococcus aureus]